MNVPFGFNRRSALKMIAGSGLFFGLGRGSAISQVRGGQYIFGSASLGSTGYVIIEAISTIVNRNSELDTSSQSTSGGAENMQLIGQDLLDFGQSSSVDWIPATRGEAPFREPIEARQMFCYTTFCLPPIVMAGSDIKTFEDLKGRRVAPGAAGGSTAQSWRLMFTEASLVGDIDWTYGSWREVYDGFMSEAIDCVPAILSNLKPAPLVVELTTNHEIRPVPFPEDLIKRAQEANPGVMRFEVTPETWPAIKEPTVGTGSSGILAAHPSVSHETAYEVTRAVFDNAEALRSISRELESVTLEDATRYLIPGIPVNAGAAQYLKEKNVWRDDLSEA